jgi:hypothetical protein
MAFGRALVKEAAPLRDFMEKDSAFVKITAFGGTSPGDLVVEGGDLGFSHPLPRLVGGGIRARGDPKGPPQDLRQRGR